MCKNTGVKIMSEEYIRRVNSILDYYSDELNEWEANFLQQIVGWINQHKPLTDKMRAKIDQINNRVKGRLV